MANITPYDPGGLPNPAVGTPGVNQAAGAAEEALAQGSANARDTVAGLANQQSGNLGNLISLIGHGIGNVVKDVVANRQAEKAQVNAMAVQAQSYRGARAMNDAYYDAERNFQDDPENIMGGRQPGDENGLENKLNSVHQQVLDASGLKGAALAKLDNELLQHKNTLLDRGDRFSLDKQTALALKVAPTVVEDAISTISNLTGSPTQNLQNYTDAVQNAKAKLEQMHPLGKANIEAFKADIDRRAPVEYFRAMASDTPADPEKQLVDLQQKRNLLESGAFKMHASDKESLLGHFHALENQAAMGIERKLAVKELSNQADARIYKTNLDQNWSNKASNYQALEYVKQHVADLQAKAVKIQKSSYPDRTKDAYLKQIKAEVATYDSVATAANANLKHIHTLEVQGANEARRQRDHEAAENRRQARELLKGNQQQSQYELNGMVQQLTVLKQDPVKNKDQIVQLAAQIHDQSDKMFNAEYLTAAQTDKYQRAAMGIVTGVEQMDQHVFAPFGFTIPGLPAGPVKKQPFDKTIDARTEGLNKVVGGIANLERGQKQAEMHDAAKLSEGQRQYFDAQYGAWLSQRNAAGKPPTEAEKQRMEHQLTALSKMQKVSK